MKSNLERPSAMPFARSIPILRIFDEALARDFYCSFLGFAVDWEHRLAEGFPLYMQVSLSDCLLHLTGHHGDCCPGSAVLVPTEGLEAYQRALLAKNHKHAKPGLEETDWGTYQMAIKDPFGNSLIFSEALDRSDG